MTTPLSAQSVSGFVTDDSNGERLIAVNIFLADTYLGTTSNKDGFYSLRPIPPGTYRIIFSYIGFEKLEKKITLTPGEALELDVALTPSVVEGPSIEIVSERVQDEERVQTSTLRITPRILEKAPRMAEADLMRTLQMMPGVLTLSEFSSGLYIRGGTPDQNLILLDGSEVYNVNHLFGIFSTFDVDAVKQVDLIKGGFPAAYGGRLSSVLDITNRDGNQKQFEGKAAVSLISAKASLQGPVGRGSWFLSGRRTYIDILLDAAKKATKGSSQEVLELIPDYYFYDVHAKLYQDLNHKNKIALTYYRGRDNMHFNVEPFDFKFLWGNSAFSGKWTHVFSDKLFANVVATLSDYTILLDEDDAFISFKVENSVKDVTLKSDLEWFASQGHTVKFGLVYKHVDSEYIQKYGEFRMRVGSASNQFSVYLQDGWALSNLLSVEFGLRGNLYRPIEFYNTFGGSNFEGRVRFDLEPRISVRYQLTEKTALKSAWGRYRQYITIVPFGNADFSFMDIWFPADNSYTPGDAFHYVTGVETRISDHIKFQGEIYYKEMPHLYEFNPNQNVLDRGADLFYAGRGFSYGADVYIEKNAGSVTGWMGYGLGWTKRKFPDLNNGKPYFPKYDRRHAFNLVVNTNLSRRWKATVSWTYETGQAYTQPISQYELLLPDRELNLIIGEDRNASRLPPYHRLDLGLRYEKETKKGFIERWVFALQVFNVYNRKNIWFRSVRADVQPPEDLQIQMLPIVPTFGFEVFF